MGRGAALRSGHHRRGALRSSRAARRARVRSRSHAAAAGPRRGGGGSLQHLPLLPLPAAQIKKQQKATNHPRAERGAAGGGRSVRRPDSAGGAHGWARAGQGWDAGPGFGGQGSGDLLARLGRLLSPPPPPPPLLPPPLPLPPALGGRAGGRVLGEPARARAAMRARGRGRPPRRLLLLLALCVQVSGGRGRGAPGRPSGPGSTYSGAAARGPRGCAPRRGLRAGPPRPRPAARPRPAPPRALALPYF